MGLFTGIGQVVKTIAGDFKDAASIIKPEARLTAEAVHSQAGEAVRDFFRIPDFKASSPVREVQ